MNNDPNTSARFSELRRLIGAADDAYHTHGNATVEDALYDAWKDELARLHPDDPRLKRVGERVQEIPNVTADEAERIALDKFSEKHSENEVQAVYRKCS